MRKEVASDIKLTVRMTREERETLNKFCADRGMKVSDFVRTAIAEKMKDMEDKK